MSKRDELRRLEKRANQILDKDPKTQAEKVWKKKRARMTEARYAKVVSNRRKPNLIEMAMKDAWDSCKAPDES
jgi:hypothetical protein